MGADVVDLGRVDAGVLEGDGGRPGRLRAVGPWLDHVVGVGRGAVAEQLRVRDGAARLRDVGRFEHEQRRALAHDEAVAPRVKGSGGVTRVVVVAVRQGPDDVERAERERTQRDLDAARDGRIDPPFAQVTHRLAQRDRARRA